mmetsp:Transcript_27887/g.73183  ORF Transcript_27887/g.73183 Transcript_27887/m.73183 type:complete len:289 (+) Transcript_27887:1101-1967(+)
MLLFRPGLPPPAACRTDGGTKCRSTLVWYAAFHSTPSASQQPWSKASGMATASAVAAAAAVRAPTTRYPSGLARVPTGSRSAIATAVTAHSDAEMSAPLASATSPMSIVAPPTRHSCRSSVQAESWPAPIRPPATATSTITSLPWVLIQWTPRIRDEQVGGPANIHKGSRTASVTASRRLCHAKFPNDIVACHADDSTSRRPVETRRRASRLADRAANTRAHPWATQTIHTTVTTADHGIVTWVMPLQRYDHPVSSRARVGGIASTGPPVVLLLPSPPLPPGGLTGTQ